MGRTPAGASPALREALAAADPRSVRVRLTHAVPVIAQCAVMAGAAWWVAQNLLGHTQPVFAATGAVVCLAAGVGGRARQAVDLLAGVLAGVAVGELIRRLEGGSGTAQTVLVVALAMTLAAILDARPLAFIQAGAASLFVLTLPASQSAGDHLLNAAVGGVFGLIGSQVIFSPDPLKVVARPVRATLGSAANATRTAARALDQASPELASTACGLAREAHGRLGDLAHARLVARQVTGRTVRGHRRAARIRQIEDRLDDIDMAVAAILLLVEDIRSGIGGRPAPATPQLVGQLNALATGLDEVASRRQPPIREAGAAPAPPAHAVGWDHPDGPTGTHLRDATAALDRLCAATIAPAEPIR
ncbi:MAG TPA: FUSC family protein [Micromonosporaceae bacterium]|nr:FUSC family protein [Micromonosporaceae bacterium]